MKNVTVILPIHKWDEDYKLMFENAVKSVEEFYNDVKLTIVGPKDVISNIQLVSDKLETKVLTNDGSSDFCSQVNLGIENCDTEWFSILEVEFQKLGINTSISEKIHSFGHTKMTIQ